MKRHDITVDSANGPNEPPDCGLLHDNMSLRCVKLKDLVNELQNPKFETLKMLQLFDDDETEQFSRHLSSTRNMK